MHFLKSTPGSNASFNILHVFALTRVRDSIVSRDLLFEKGHAFVFSDDVFVQSSILVQFAVTN